MCPQSNPRESICIHLNCFPLLCVAAISGYLSGSRVNKYQVLVSICLHLDGISTPLFILVVNLVACWSIWLFLRTFFSFLFFNINLMLSRRSRWPKSLEWSHLGLTVLMISIGWKDSLSDTASVLPRRSNVWDQIYSSADMSLTGIKRWKASVLTYWTAPFCPAAAPLPRIDDRNCPFATSQSSSCKYSNGAYAGAPHNPDS